jgi:hypothetical protein
MDLPLLMSIAGAILIQVVVIYLLVDTAFQAKRRDHDQARMLEVMTRLAEKKGVSDPDIHNITTLN